MRGLAFEYRLSSVAELTLGGAPDEGAASELSSWKVSNSEMCDHGASSPSCVQRKVLMIFE